jgi:hypothetical protein
MVPHQPLGAFLSDPNASGLRFFPHAGLAVFPMARFVGSALMSATSKSNSLHWRRWKWMNWRISMPICRFLSSLGVGDAVPAINKHREQNKIIRFHQNMSEAQQVFYYLSVHWPGG